MAEAGTGTRDGGAAAPPLSRRARSVLERLFADVRSELETQLPHVIEATELALSEPLASGKPALEAARINSLRSLGSDNKFFVQRFLAHVEAAFQSPVNAATPATATDDPPAQMLALVDDGAGDSDEMLLETTANRLGSRNSLALQLLGQRFGVLARAPAFEPEALPVGPQVLCAGLAGAVDALDLSPHARLQLFLQFEKALVDVYPTLLDGANDSLARAGILPFLSYVPVRRLPGAVGKHGEGSDYPGNADDAQPTPEALASARMRSKQRAPIDASFSTLQTLLQRRRAVLAKLRPASRINADQEKNRPTLDHDEVLEALKRLRANNTRAESVQEYRQILLAQARQQHGRGVALSEADEDTFDLLALFLAQIQRALRRSSPGHSLMDKLFLPMVLAAMRDPVFFTDANHPARELLDAVSLSGARWLAEDDLDTQWLGLLQRAVGSVHRDGDGSPETFAEANQTLQSGLQSLIRKAEMAERRQVEAARGRERLAVARLRANEAITALQAGRTLPQYHDVFLHHAWIDVLSLAYLRGGDDSDAWRGLMDATRHVIDAGLHGDPAALSTTSLNRICETLEQVGYHTEDAAAIADALVPQPPGSAIEAQRARLLDKLGSRARLGEDALARGDGRHDLSRPEEKQAYEQLRNASIPSWIEYTGDPEHPLRRRLAWIGESSGQALLVNRRGLQAEEESLTGLARKLAAGNVQLLDSDASPAKSAWEATLDSLLPLAPGDDKDKADGR